MLTSLYVRHFAVVEEAEIAFGPGLTVVSGETGAGKSLLVDALMLLAGARADSGMVRAGSDRAELTAEFDLADLPEAREWLRREELDEEDSCQLRRVIRAEGSSRAWINGRPANASQLGELATLLVEIHGQHEHQALLSRAHQLELLDAYAGNEALVAQVRELATQWRDIGQRIRKLSGGDEVISMAILNHFEAPAEERAAYLKQANALRRSEDAEEIETVADADAEDVNADAVTLSPERFAAMQAGEQFVLTVSNKGFGKRSSSFEFRTSGRGGKGIVAMVANERNGRLLASFPIDEKDQIMLVTDGGQLIRCPVDGIRIAGRNTQGVRIFKTEAEEKVVSVERITEEEADEEQNGNGNDA